jgi:hypothetical protein
MMDKADKRYRRIDLMGAAMLLVEIGADMGVFGSAQRLGPPVQPRVVHGHRTHGGTMPGQIYLNA